MASILEKVSLLVTKARISLIPGGVQALQAIQNNDPRFVIVTQIENKAIGESKKTWEFDLSTERGKRRYSAITRLAGMLPVGHREQHTILDNNRRELTEIGFTKTQ